MQDRSLPQNPFLKPNPFRGSVSISSPFRTQTEPTSFCTFDNNFHKETGNIEIIPSASSIINPSAYLRLKQYKNARQKNSFYTFMRIKELTRRGKDKYRETAITNNCNLNKDANRTKVKQLRNPFSRKSLLNKFDNQGSQIGDQYSDENFHFKYRQFNPTCQNDSYGLSIDLLKSNIVHSLQNDNHRPGQDNLDQKVFFGVVEKMSEFQSKQSTGQDIDLKTLLLDRVITFGGNQLQYDQQKVEEVVAKKNRSNQNAKIVNSNINKLPEHTKIKIDEISLKVLRFHPKYQQSYEIQVKGRKFYKNKLGFL